MTNAYGTPIWYELLTSDADAAQAFYAHVVGWQITANGMPGMDYRILSAPDGDGIGGLMQRPPGMAGEPTWLVYLGVADVDASTQAVTAAGGSLHMPPMTLDGVGRMAMVADPFGAPFYVMRGASDEESRAFRPGDAATHGHAVWNELTSPDPDAAIAFYAAQFGWRQDGAMPMGDLGDYKFLFAGEAGIGAAMGRMPHGKDGWLPYFLLPEIDAAAARVTAAGGEVLHGPVPIPGGSFSMVAQDPQGARVGLVGPRS